MSDVSRRPGVEVADRGGVSRYDVKIWRLPGKRIEAGHHADIPRNQRMMGMAGSRFGSSGEAEKIEDGEVNDGGEGKRWLQLE